MVKPNWDIFKAKFSENPESNFEWLCYLLFCREFNKLHGIFRYRNQSAIETNPIKIDNEVIGWQAKFYNSPLSEHKKDFLNSIRKAKEDYPNITKLYFYSNKEWGQNKGREPAGLIEIEKKAKAIDIKLEWKLASYFESEFVAVKNEDLAKLFFSRDESIFDLIKKQEDHTRNILSQIKNHIDFNGQVIDIDRSKIFEKLKNESQRISILSGVAGVGKTGLVKKLYEQLKIEIPFYVFKATEFELTNLDDLYKDTSFHDFSAAHIDHNEKIIVIDSAERLLELRNTDPFKEFLLILVNDNWKVIFTTRDNYLEDLNYRFLEIYNIKPSNIKIDNLGLEELHEISDKYSFSLPMDEKLMELVRNPFYLNEYLKIDMDKGETEYIEFKNKLWNMKVKQSQPQREQCFLKIAIEKANSGQFFITLNDNANILDELVEDGILGYESAGYFITHDIYEEWALEKNIEKAFVNREGSKDFFEAIGQSLPIRRCFRNWLSEKLLLKDVRIEGFIKEVVENELIESFWKDEILVSVLLSDYSEVFFDIFKDKLLSNKQKWLKKLTFILRIACKEVDEDFFKQLGVKSPNLLSLKYVPMRPKGQGWESLIKFIHDNMKEIGIENIYFVLPMIHDWNSKFKEGETTKLSSIIALRFYQWSIKKNLIYSSDATEEKILYTILYGASEVKDELKEVFSEILKNKWKNHSDPYYNLSKAILTKFGVNVIYEVLPEYVLQLADLFWSYTKNENDLLYGSREKVEQCFGLEGKYEFKYFPASAYQTPIYCLLQGHHKETIDFILNFTNKSVQEYAVSRFSKTLCEVKVFGDDENEITQYLSHCLWNMYRGTSSPVSPYLLQSIHMALEKYLLEIGKNIESKALESWLFYLLKHSKSASISSVVGSVVLAYPEKTFNVAKSLFQTKEFILNDMTRWVYEQSAKSLYSMRYHSDWRHKYYEEERMKTCEDKHRKFTLENLFLNYQCFRSEEIGEDEAIKRQKVLWEILDNYYKELPPESEQIESDKVWRMCLARMDKRKMKITAQKTDEGVAIQFEPELDVDIKKHSEDTLKKNNENTNYISLKLWAEYKFSNDDKYKQYEYERYEKDPKLALKEVKDVVAKLSDIDAPDDIGMLYHNEDRSIPAYVCSVLLRDHIKELTEGEKIFCKGIVLEKISSSLCQNYPYQISDGTKPAISVLPSLLAVFPDEKEKIKITLLLIMLNEHRIDDISNVFLIMSPIWKNNFDDAQSLLVGYLLLMPRYEALIKSIREENFKRRIYEFREDQLLEMFHKNNEHELKDIVENNLSLSSLTDIGKYDLSILGTSFQMIPRKTNNDTHKKIARMIISAFAEKLINDRRDNIDSRIKHDFLITYAYFVLNLPKDEIQDYLKPFLDHFNAFESIADLFQEFILAEDSLNTYDNFWLVWDCFKEKVVESCKNSPGHYWANEIVESYLFARTPWKETTKEWNTLKEQNKLFFSEISQKIGHCPSVLYAISKLLNDIGSNYIDDGIIWISDILQKNQNLANEKLENNSIYYMENIVRRYILENEEKIKKTRNIKDKLLLILDFLIKKESAIGYRLREKII